MAFVVPSPSWPSSLSPQVNTSPAKLNKTKIKKKKNLKCKLDVKTWYHFHSKHHLSDCIQNKIQTCHNPYKCLQKSSKTAKVKISKQIIHTISFHLVKRQLRFRWVVNPGLILGNKGHWTQMSTSMEWTLLIWYVNHFRLIIISPFFKALYKQSIRAKFPVAKGPSWTQLTFSSATQYTLISHYFFQW